jgi:hypothetical protein
MILKNIFILFIKIVALHSQLNVWTCSASQSAKCLNLQCFIVLQVQTFSWLWSTASSNN